MQLLMRKIRIEYVGLVLKPSIFRHFSLILLSVSMSGCILNNPAHSPAIEGDIDISKNSKGDLCFMPVLGSASIMENSIDLNHLKIENLAILDPSRQGGGYLLMKIQLKNSKFFILQARQKICLNSDNSELEQIVYEPLGEQLLAVSIIGLDDKKTHSINFYKEFNYPYTPK